MGSFRTMRRSKWFLGLAVVAAMCAPLLHSQQPAPTPHPTPPQEPRPPVFVNSKAPDYGPGTPKNPTFADMQYSRYIAARLKSMNSDAEKLLRLAVELNAKIDPAGSGSLSREDLSKVGEIEKLAHNVKWKMQLAADANRTP